MTASQIWKAEKKLSIIKEIRENNKIFERCRKYSVDPNVTDVGFSSRIDPDLVY